MPGEDYSGLEERVRDNELDIATLKEWMRAVNEQIKTFVTKSEFGPVKMIAYTLPECKAILSDSLAGYAESVRGMTPGFDKLTDGQKAAVVDGAYNFGLANYKGSTLRVMYSRAEFPVACEQFMKWRFINHGKTDCAIAANKCGGIYTRRKLERAACLGE